MNPYGSRIEAHKTKRHLLIPRDPGSKHTRNKNKGTTSTASPSNIAVTNALALIAVLLFLPASMFSAVPRVAKKHAVAKKRAVTKKAAVAKKPAHTTKQVSYESPRIPDQSTQNNTSAMNP